MPQVLVEAEGPVLKLTLNDPDRLNAIGEPMAREILAAVEDAADPSAGHRCLLLTGAGRGFCAGGSLGLMQGGDGTGGSGISLGTHHHRVMRLLRNLPFPVVTAVNGPAAGLGFSYALAGDLVVAAKSAYFLAAFRNVGVSPDGGLSWMLPKIVGWSRAKELLLLGKRLPAGQALEWGLVNRVFDDDTFMDEATRLARELAAGPTLALGEMRQLLYDSWEQGFDAQLDAEERRQLVTFGSSDAREGAMALVEKRAPVFNGR